MNQESSNETILKLESFIKKHKLSRRLSLKKMREMVFNDAETKVTSYVGNILDIIDPQSEDVVHEALDFAMTAWNHLPHKSLGGKTPHEMSLLPSEAPHVESMISSPFMAVKDGEDSYDLVEKISSDMGSAAFFEDLERVEATMFLDWSREIILDYEEHLYEERTDLSDKECAAKSQIISELIAFAIEQSCASMHDISSYMALVEFPKHWCEHHKKPRHITKVRDTVIDFHVFLEDSGSMNDTI